MLKEADRYAPVGIKKPLSSRKLEWTFLNEEDKSGCSQKNSKQRDHPSICWVVGHQKIDKLKLLIYFFYAIRTNSDEKEQRIPSHLLMRG